MVKKKKKRNPLDSEEKRVNARHTCMSGASILARKQTTLTD